MASAHIQALLSNPSEADSRKRTLGFLDSRFKTYEDFEQSEEFDEILQSSHLRNEEIQSKVRTLITRLITNNRNLTDIA